MSLFLLLLALMEVVVPQILFYDLGLPLFFIIARDPLKTDRDYFRLAGIVAAVDLCLAVRNPHLPLSALATAIVATYTWRMVRCELAQI